MSAVRTRHRSRSAVDETHRAGTTRHNFSHVRHCSAVDGSGVFIADSEECPVGTTCRVTPAGQFSDRDLARSIACGHVLSAMEVATRRGAAGAIIEADRPTRPVCSGSGQCGKKKPLVRVRRHRLPTPEACRGWCSDHHTTKAVPAGGRSAVVLTEVT